jgi:ParB family chromosome partitioning protein
MSEPGARPALGRGLAALLRDSGEQAEDVTPQASVRNVPLDHLRPNPAQPRKTFAEEELQQLADSISAKGILQPLLACTDPEAPGQYQIVAGERRWRAAQLAGLATAPVMVRTDLTELDLLEIGVIENVQREDLKPLEEAGAYRTLIRSVWATPGGGRQDSRQEPKPCGERVKAPLSPAIRTRRS